jgi:hypothetical protein
MILEKFTYTSQKGWSVKDFPNLDSPTTLILIFAGSDYLNNPQPIKDLSAKYPLAKMIGCSSAGEIFGESVTDDSLSVAIAKFEKTQLRIVKQQLAGAENSYEVGKAIAQDLFQKDLRAIFILSEGLKN